MAMAFDLARTLADDLVQAAARTANDEYALIDTETEEYDGGWVFFYNTKEFLETGDYTRALAGNGPIYVDKFGRVHRLPTAIPWQEAIKSV